MRADFDAANRQRSQILHGHDGQTFPALGDQVMTSDGEETSTETKFLQQGQCKLHGFDIGIVESQQNWLVGKRIAVFIPS
jgi:hypothetical protein